MRLLRPNRPRPQGEPGLGLALDDGQEASSTCTIGLRLAQSSSSTWAMRFSSSIILANRARRSPSSVIGVATAGMSRVRLCLKCHAKPGIRRHVGVPAPSAGRPGDQDPAVLVVEPNLGPTRLARPAAGRRDVDQRVPVERLSDCLIHRGASW